MTCGCGDPHCWRPLDRRHAREVLPWEAWPRMGIDTRFELLRRGYGYHSVVDVHLPD